LAVLAVLGRIHHGSEVSIELIARTVRGIEYVAADEISALSPTRLAMQQRQVTFRLDRPDARLAGLRTVDDLFLSLGSIDGIGHRKDALPRIAEHSESCDWRQALAVVEETRAIPARRRFDVVASLLGGRNYSRYDVEDAVGAKVARLLGGQYVTRRAATGHLPSVDLTVRVFIGADTAAYALRLGAGPLHRRGYKQDASRGTLHPPMAAAMARLQAVQAGCVVVDPFCGDGTIPIEVAAVAPQATVHGSDLDAARIANAVANANRADVRVSFTVADAARLEFSNGSVDVLVTNPPWNVGVDASGRLAGGLDRFWHEVSRVLSPAGRAGLIMDAEHAAATTLRARGFAIHLRQNVRLAGRLSELVVCTPSGSQPWSMPEHIAALRAQARESGLITDIGFD
jgi:23S rRNA G2445 N2-methylase RlmL